MKKNSIIAISLFFVPFLIFGQVFDFEGNKYDTIQLGKQVWLKQNIRSKKYYDGKVLDSKNYKCPNGDCSKADSFGLIYNYSGLTNGENKKIINGICPLGYSIPTPQNWHELMLFLNADTTYLWKDAYNNVKYKIIDETYGGTGETDLSILPAGINVNDVYNGFGMSANLRLIDSNTHKSVYITFDGGSTGTVNVFNLATELVKSLTYYQSCRCIKTTLNTSIEDLRNIQDYDIFPNPCRGTFMIQSKVELEIISVELISLNGQIHKLISNDQGMYYISNKPAGIYFIKISDMLNTQYIKLIIL